MVDERRFMAWVFRIAYFNAIDYGRGTKRFKKGIIPFEELDQEPRSNEPTPDDSIIDDEVKKIVRDTIDSLKPRDRDILLLYYFHGLTHSEIAEKLQIRENMSKKHLERAKKAFKQKICRVQPDILER